MMSRVGITYEEVAQAAYEIEKKGETATIDKVRAHIGDTGSFTTISKYLNMWRQKIIPVSKSNENMASTPDIVKAAVDRVWQDMREETNKEIEVIKTEAQKLVEDAEHRARIAEEALNKVNCELNELKQIHMAQAAEKELLALDLKSLREAHTLLQERFKSLEEKYAEMQAVTSNHLENMSRAHQKEISRLEESLTLEKTNHANSIGSYKDQIERDRQTHIATLDNLKIENKKLNEMISKMRNEQQASMAETNKIEAELAILKSEKEALANQIGKHQQQWTNFYNKSLISDEVVTKIHEFPKFDQLINQINLIFTDSMDKKLSEFVEAFRTRKLKKLTD
ncbi:MAG: DNA-binding protein [Gammaproteobacteria bacterium]